MASGRFGPVVLFTNRALGSLASNQVYGGNGVTIIASAQVTLDNITLWSMPGMGFYSGDSTDITLRNCGIRRRAGLPMSITADASHFSQCTGEGGHS